METVQYVSWGLGIQKAIKGTEVVEVIDMPIPQHLARSKYTSVIGRVADLNTSILSASTQNPLKNVTVTARMHGYPYCSNRLVTSD